MHLNQLQVSLVLLTTLLSTASWAETTQARDSMTLPEFGRMYWPVELSNKRGTTTKCEDLTCLKRGDYFFVVLDMQPGERHGTGRLRTVASSIDRSYKFPASFEIEYIDESAGTFEVLRLLFFDHVNSGSITLIKQMIIVPIAGDEQSCLNKLQNLSNFSSDERESQCDGVAPLVYWKINTLALIQDSKIVPLDDDTTLPFLSHPEDGQGTGKGQ